MLFLHLVTLWAFAIAQPLYDLLGQNPEFFLVRRTDGFQLGLIVAVLSWLLPSLLGLLVLILFRVSRRMARFSYGTVFILLVALLLMAALKQIQSDFHVGTLLAIVFLGAVSVGLYHRFYPVQLFLTFASPGTVVIPLLFLGFSPMTALFSRRPPTPSAPPLSVVESSRPPIVMLVFDELPLFSLLDGNGNIDATRFPNFSELARQATWYKNATTVAESTHFALAGLLSGVYPASQSVASHHQYPNNLFTLLAGTHELNVFESITQLCPPELCPRDNGDNTLVRRMTSILKDLTIVYGHLTLPEQLALKLPDIRNVWMLGRSPFLRHSHFEEFLESLGRAKMPRLHFYHSPLPHYPWNYLPSGKRYSSYSRREVFFEGQRWSKSEAVVQHAFQRYLLQLGYADRVLGKLMRRLRQTGLFDRVLFVVLADHGMAFRPGGSRRHADQHNLSEIMSVPLLVRFPGQVEGSVSSANAELVDLVPTIVDVVNVPLTWEVDGVSLLSDTSSQGEQRRILRENVVTPLVRSQKATQFRKGVCLQGRMHSIGTGNLVGALRGFEKTEKSVELWGAAGDPIAGEPAEAILVFLNGQLVQQSPVGEGRPYVAAYFKNPRLYASGFRFRLKSELIEHRQTPIIQLFASKGDNFGKLIYPPDYPWHESPQPAKGPRTYASSCDPEASTSYLVQEAAGEVQAEPSAEDEGFFDKLKERAAKSGSELLIPPLAFSGLLGVREDELEIQKSSFQVELEAPELCSSVDPEGTFIPAEVAGKIVESRDIPTGAQLLVVLNGVVSNIVPLFQDVDGQMRFLAVLPERSFAKGSNRLSFYLIWKIGDQIRLASTTA